MAEADISDWNAIAPVYASQIEAQGDRCLPDIGERFWEILGDVGGKRILDLGCGQGWLTQELSKRGGTVAGIDGSEALVSRARVLFPGGDFRIADVSAGLPELGTEFDVVVSHMVVMDIPEIDVLFASVGKALGRGGRFLFTLPHPCFFMQKSHRDEDGAWYKKLTGYLEPATRRIASFGGHNHYHRPLSHYVCALRDAGLLLYEFYEPPHEVRSDRVDPAFARRFPVFLLVGAKKVEV